MISQAVADERQAYERTRTTKLDAVQALRALAAFLVVLCHGAVEIRHRSGGLNDGFWDFVRRNGLFGVDIFFIISGFIMVYVIRPQRSGLDVGFSFLKERLIRIAPLYWLATIGSILIGVTAPAVKNHTAFSPAYIMRSLLFIPSINPGSGAHEPVLGLGWTLNFEMFFYVILFALIAAGIRPIITGVIVVLTGLFLAGLVFPHHSVIIEAWTSSLLLEFVFGACLAMARTYDFRLNGLSSLALAALGIAIWLLAAPMQKDRFLMRGLEWGPAAACIFASVVLARHQFRYPAWVLLIGNASYSLYLSHLFTMRALAVLLFRLPLPISIKLVMFALIFPLLALYVAVLSYRLIEIPMLNWGRRVFLKKRLDRATSA